jgi:hypothetical protein
MNKQSDFRRIYGFVVYLTTVSVNDTTYLLTPWSRVLLEKLTGFAASQEIPRIYGTRKFITVLTSARHLLRDTPPRNTPPWRCEWGSSLPPDCLNDTTQHLMVRMVNEELERIWKETITA